AIIIIVAGVVMYKNLYAAPREEKAQAALFKGQEYFEADAYAQALNGDSIGYAGFIKIADQYSGTKAANLAKAYMGICYAQLGQYDEAVKALDSFDGNDLMVAPAMIGAMGNCYAQLGQMDKAASMLLKAADKADNNSLSPIYLLQAGQILVKQGKYDDAIKAYTTIKDKYFRSYQAMDIDRYIEQAKLMKK
ncbi:tetratricopeptide repeat protein, partial [Bacteroides sp. KG68]